MMIEQREKHLQDKLAKAPLFQGCFNYFPRALKEVARVSALGAQKHQFSMADKGFLNPEYTEFGYLDSAMRHVADEAIEGPVNEEDGKLYHRAQAAWNLLASLEKMLIAMDDR